MEPRSLLINGVIDPHRAPKKFVCLGYCPLKFQPKYHDSHALIERKKTFNTPARIRHEWRFVGIEFAHKR